MNLYAISAELKEYLSIEDPGVFSELDELLFRRNGLAVVAEQAKGCYSGTFLYVLQLIASATLRWKKPYELLRANDFVQGRPDSGCYSPGLSERTVFRALRRLCEQDFLSRITASDGRDVHYALNLDVILPLLGKAIDARVGKSLVWQETKRLYTVLTESEDVRKISDCVRRFSGSVIHDINKFIQKIKTIKEAVVAKLSASVSKTKKQIREYSEDRMDKKAQSRIIEGHSVDAKAGLCLWHKEVRDADAYPGYVSIQTGKVRKQMEHWLRELAREDVTDEQFRVMVKMFVRKWQHVPDNKREIQTTSASGKPYKVRMPFAPNFDVFYALRTAVRPLLEDTIDPDCNDDGTERGTTSYHY